MFKIWNIKLLFLFSLWFSFCTADRLTTLGIKFLFWRSVSAHILLTNNCSTLFISPLRYFALCFQLLQASQFFMLDSLKRHCERLAAGNLDCENVVDTYVYAKVSMIYSVPVRYCRFLLCSVIENTKRKGWNTSCRQSSLREKLNQSDEHFTRKLTVAQCLLTSVPL